MEIRQSAGKDFAYLLGVYLGDGCVTRNGNNPVFRLNTIDEDFAEATKRALFSITGKTARICKHDVSKSSKPNYSLQCNGINDLCHWLVENTENKTCFPQIVLRSHKIAFIEGLMDSEGFVAANSNPTNRRYYMGYKSCDPWVQNFILILQSVGIRIGKVSTEKPKKAGYKQPTRFAIKIQSWIDSGAKFNIARKQNRVDEWASAGAYENRSRYPRRSTSETNTPNTAR